MKTMDNLATSSCHLLGAASNLLHHSISGSSKIKNLRKTADTKSSKMRLKTTGKLFKNWVQTFRFRNKVYLTKRVIKPYIFKEKGRTKTLILKNMIQRKQASVSSGKLSKAC